MRRAPMTRQEAEENVSSMKAKTQKAAMKTLLEMALGKSGNLSGEAKEVYRAALQELPE